MNDDILQSVSQNEIQIDETSDVVVDVPSDNVSPEDIVSSESSIDGEILGDGSVIDEETLFSSDSVSDNDVNIFTVSGNGSVDFPYSAEDFTTLSETVTDIYNELTTINLVVVSLSATLSMFFVFTIFKWCEQKIRSFRKGMVDKK